MALNERLTILVREALANHAPVEEKKMFHGLAFMVEGKLLLCIGQESTLFRIDPSIHEIAIEKPGVKALLMKGRECKGYVYVDLEILEASREFNYWLELSLDFNKRAKSSKKKKK